MTKRSRGGARTRRGRHSLPGTAHNQRIFRTARSILGDDSEAEDVVQATYVSAFRHLDQFRGESRLATWLTLIAANESLARLRRQRPTGAVEEIDAAVS
jgi:RNA polymerase sigma-70 factor (ECF subfamily)